MQSINAVLDFLISQASARSGKFGGAVPPFCEESVAIFDELDSLAADEFAQIYAVYLVGSDAERSLEKAQQAASAAKFAPLETIAHDPNLHDVLSRGAERWRWQTRQN